MSHRPKILVVTRWKYQLGLIPSVMEEAGCEWDVSLRPSAPSLDKSRHWGVMLLGDEEQSADDRGEYGAEMKCVCEALQNGIAVLGICHGAQLLAGLYGWKLKKGGTKLLDDRLTQITLTEHGAKDPVLCNVRGSRVPQHHVDWFEVPEAAVKLAESTSLIQKHVDAFRVCRNVYGLQFHPEPTFDMLVAPEDEDGWNLKQPREELEKVVQTGRLVLRAWVEIALSGWRNLPAGVQLTELR